MEQRMMVTEDDVFELLAFLVTSARLCVDEPRLYGTFRLVDGASRLIGFVLQSDQLEDRQSLQQLKDEIDEKKLLLTTDQEGYVNFLDDLTRKVARELKERAGVAV
jgi:hypothetical protein